jgi:exodeoxyribonuclease V gamma subunit
LRGARVAWGLDAAMKASAGAAAIEANSWQFGFDRLYAGLVAGNEADVVLPGGIVPLAGVGGGEVDAIGQLDHLLLELRQFRDGLALPRTLVDWSAWLGDRFDALFEVDLRDDAESAASDALRRVVGELADEGAQAVPEQLQPWSVVREALAGALAEVPERQPFLLGGVTFCGLVPQRSIPFRMICLLGMNEGEFPRAGGDAGLNRMLAKPRRGDRDTRSEDRYLFLEALMAARTRLHVSYVGVAVKDGQRRNPASPLAELLQLLDEQFGIAADSSIGRPWCVVHPLQPFDPRYYERTGANSAPLDPRLYSYDATFLPRALPAVASARFFDPQPIALHPAQGEFALDALLRFWRDPVRSALRDGNGLDLDVVGAEGWPDREPLTPAIDPRERFEHRLLFDALERGSDLSQQAPPWLARSGVLAAGAPGELAYAALVAQVAPVLATAREVLATGALQRDAQAIDLDLGDGLRLVGRIDRVFRARDGGWLLFDAQPRRGSDLREWLGLHIEWAALRLALGNRVDVAFIESPKGKLPRMPEWLGILRTHDEAGLRAGLHRLVDIWQAASQRPLLFFPATASAYADASADERERKARTQWEGSGFGPGERDYAPGYAQLATRGLDLFDPHSPGHAAFVEAVGLVAGVLDPQRSVLFMQDGGSAPRSRARHPLAGER